MKLLPVALYIGLGLGLLTSVYAWHRAAVREAEQRQLVEKSVDDLKKANEQHKAVVDQYEERIRQYDQRFAKEVARVAASVQRVEAITKEAQKQIDEAPNLDDDAILDGIRQRIARPVSATVNP